MNRELENDQLNDSLTQGQRMTGACREYAYNAGAERPDTEWLCTDFDTWERNPHYTGPAGPHPEDAPEDRRVRVTATSLEEIEEKVIRLNRRAAKLNLPAIEIDQSPAAPLACFRRDDITVALELSDDRVEALKRDHRYRFRLVSTVNVEIIGQAPTLNGWRLAATLEPTPNGEGGWTNIVKSIIGENIRNEFRQAVGRCDHCRTDRRRKETFVVIHDNGDQKVVGRNCIADFLGHEDINALANYAAALAEFGASIGEMMAVETVEDDDRYFSGGTEESHFDLRAFIEMSIRACRAFGWVSGSQARYENTCSTRLKTVGHLLPPPTDRVNREEWYRDHDRLMAVTVTTDADDVIQWAKSIDGETDSDYLHNLRTIAHVEAVTPTTTGYAASMYVAHAKAVEREVERLKKDERGPSEHVGTVGERIEMNVSVDRIIEHEGQYGCVGIHKLIDDNDNELVWFASGSNWLDEDGVESYRIKATIKKHDEYNGKKQTAITRVKIQES
jgi:hypothetical protein